MNYLQGRVNTRVKEVLGLESLLSKPERIMRFIEEAAELAQAVDLPKDKLINLVEYVYNRPKGETEQEFAGSMFTLMALATGFGFDAVQVLEKEIDRVSTPEIIERIRIAHARKFKDGVGK